jgi:hypothetical protein
MPNAVSLPDCAQAELIRPSFMISDPFKTGFQGMHCYQRDYGEGPGFPEGIDSVDFPGSFSQIV